MRDTAVSRCQRSQLQAQMVPSQTNCADIVSMTRHTVFHLHCRSKNVHACCSSIAACSLAPGGFSFTGPDCCGGAGTLTHRDVTGCQHTVGGQVPRAAGACHCSRLGSLLGSAHLATGCLTLGTKCMRHCSRLGPLLGCWGLGAPLPLHHSHKHVLSGTNL